MIKIRLLHNQITKLSNYQIIFSFLLLSSCSPLKRLQPDEHFLNKNIIEVEKHDKKRTLPGASPTSIVPAPYFDKEELNTILKQKTNRKILGLVRLHLGIYHLGSVGDTAIEGRKGLSKFWKKRKRDFRNIGEPPVILDTLLTEKSRKQLEMYLERKGYFDAMVTDTIVPLKSRRRKVNVIYTLHPGDPYRIRTVDYASLDPEIANTLVELKPSSLIKEGMVYDESVLDQERDRITETVRNNGMYFFNKNYITYRVDSALNNHQTDIYLYVNRQFENLDPDLNVSNRPPENHHRYRYSLIRFYTNHEPKQQALPSLSNDTSFYKGYHFIRDRKRDYIRREALVRATFITPGDLFSQTNLDLTYNRLADMNVFRFINFRFKEVIVEAAETPAEKYLLDVDIQLSPLDKHEYRIESELTHSGGNRGIAGNFSYRNRNIFRGAETFELKLSAGLESLLNFADSIQRNKFLFFNTFDFGPEVNIGLKRFLLPSFIEKKTSRSFNPKTTVSFGFNYQERPDYKRVITKASLSYQWRVSSSQRFHYYLVDINSVNVDLEPEFLQRLLDIGNPNLIYSYRNHLISSTRITYELTNQTLKLSKNYFYLRLNGESAGLLPFYVYGPVFNLDRDEAGRYILFGNVFSQYFKVEPHYKYHQFLNPTNSMVYRLAGGIGITYGNSRDQLLPFEKAFVAGGANDIRAWHARSLGPGSYSDPFLLEAGDIKLEANVEYRSALFKILETALFIDAGNTWIRNDKSGRMPGSEFSKDFVKEIAIGGGIGLRFNFTFFIFRTDFAVKLRNPALPEAERWVYANKKFVIGDVVPNLAIGYPF